MREMKILTEKDLEYFERLEAEGKAVIFRFEDTEELLQYDLEKLLAMPSEELDEETVRAWVEEQKELLQEKAKETAETREEIQKMEAEKELWEMIRDSGLPDDELQLVTEGYQNGFPEADVKELLRADLTHEQRQKKYEEIEERIHGEEMNGDEK